MLSFRSNGWFFVWFMVCGSVDFRTGELIPDPDGATSRKIYVGPFSDFGAAFDAAMGR